MDTLDGIETLEFADGPIGVSLDVNGGFVLSGSSIQDTITVTSDVGFTLEGGDGADVLEGGAGSDTLIGGEGNDTAIYEGAQSDYRFDVDQGLLTVTHIATGAVDTLDGIETLEFADGPIGVSLDVNGGFVLSGSSIQDTITVTSDAGFTLEGGAGADVLEGGAGSDTLIGGEGSDTLIGGEGNDTAIYEGAQSDYQFGVDQSGLLTVTNIATGEVDRLDGVETVRFSSTPSTAQIHLSALNGHEAPEVGESHTLTIDGVSFTYNVAEGDTAEVVVNALLSQINASFADSEISAALIMREEERWDPETDTSMFMTVVDRIEISGPADVLTPEVMSGITLSSVDISGSEMHATMGETGTPGTPSTAQIDSEHS